MKHKTVILVCCHKDDIKVSTAPYMPIHVGKALSNMELGITGDNTGDNISEKNKSYCELTGLYWAWKNLNDADILGLCHYRRYFDFHNQGKSIIPYTKFSSIDNLDFSIPENILKEVTKGKVIVPRAMNNVGSLYDEYCICHYSEDLKVLSDVVSELSEKKYIKAYNKIMKISHKPYNYNMFIMNRGLFNKYCSWLFDVLMEVENRVDISSYSPKQSRIFGYMSERLFNVFIEAEKLKVVEKPLLFIMDGKSGSIMNYILKSICNNIGFFFSTLYLRFKKN